MSSSETTTLGAEPRTDALITAVLALEDKIASEANAGYFPSLEPVGNALYDALKDDPGFIGTAAADGELLTALAGDLNALHNSLAEDLLFPYPVSGDPSQGPWLVPTLRWGFLYAAAKVTGASLVGRQKCREDLTAYVNSYRATLLPSRGPATPLPATPVGTANQARVAQSPDGSGRSILPTAFSTTTSNVDDEYHRGHRRAKQLAETSGLKPFSGSSDNFIHFIDSVKSILLTAPFCSGVAKIEFVFLHLTGAARTTMRQKAAAAQVYDLPDDKGFHTLLGIMYKQYATPEARRAAVRAWQSLKQKDKETVKDYIARFEDQRVLHDLRQDPLDEPTLITKVAEGLTSGAGMAARALCDPLTHLDYQQYIDTLVNFSTGFEGNIFNTANNTSAFPNMSASPSTMTPSDRKVQSSSRVQLMSMPASSRRRGQCYRCGKVGHVARLCRAPRPIDSLTRCRSCGSREHRREDCPKKGMSAPCRRCGATGHAASICLSPTCNPTPATPMAVATAQEEDPHLEVVNEVMEIEPMAYSMSADKATVDSSFRGQPLSNLIDNKPWQIRLTIGQRPEGTHPKDPSPCCHVDGLLDSGAGANFISSTVVNFALRRNLIDMHLLRSINPIKVTYGNGQTAICTQAVKLPLRFSLQAFSNAEAPTMVWLHCLMVKDTKPSVIIGRPGMTALGVRATIPSWAYNDPSNNVSNNNVLCYSALSTLTATSDKETSTDDTHFDDSSPTDISFDTVHDMKGAKRLCIRAPCFETAKIIPFSEKARPRSVLESAILHARVLQMYRENKVEPISAADATIILETVLVDKLSTGNGPKLPPPHHLPDADLRKRYRVTLDARPVNNLHLTVAGKHFQWVPSSSSSALPKPDLQTQNQHQQGPIDIINNWPGFATAFYGRLDLSDAYYSISIPERIRSLFCFRTTCTVIDETDIPSSLGDSFLWRLKRLPQGWSYSPLIFSRAISYLLSLFRARHTFQVHIDHYQDDLILGAANEKTLNQCIEKLSEFLEDYGFVVNRQKSTYASTSIRFCGYVLDGPTFKPEGSQQALTKGLSDSALHEFFHYKRNALLRQLKWLRSWAGKFQYYRGWLTPDSIADLKLFFGRIKALQVQGARPITDDESLCAAFARLTESVFGGRLPALHFGLGGSSTVGTLLVVDANATGWSGVCFRIESNPSNSTNPTTESDTFEQPGDHAFYDATSEVVQTLRALPHPGFSESQRLRLLPLKIMAGSWSDASARQSSTWRERASQLLCLDDSRPYLRFPTIIVSDNANSGRHWNNIDSDFGGKWMRLVELYHRSVHYLVWCRRTGLPQLADHLARLLCEGVALTGTKNTPDIDLRLDLHNTHSTATDDDDDDDGSSISSVCNHDEPAPESDPERLLSAQGIEPIVAFLNKVSPDILTELSNAQKQDTLSSYLHLPLAKVIDFLEHGLQSRTPDRLLQRLAPRFCIINGLLWYQSANSLKLFIPAYSSPLLKTATGTTEAPSFRSWLFNKYHDTLAGCHRGGFRLAATVARNFWWPSILRDAAHYARTCLRCQVGKVVLQPHTGDLSSTMMRATRPMEGLVIDFCGPFPVKDDDPNRCDYCLVVIDLFTRWMFLCPTIGNSSTAAVGALWSNVIMTHGAPDYLHSDLGSHFTSSIISHFESRFGICHTYPASKNPRVQGAAERAVRELKTSLRLLQPYLLAQEDWKDVLPVVSFVHNTSPPPYIPAYYDLTPYMMLFGRSAPDVFIGNRQATPSTEADSPYSYIDDLQRRLQEAHDLWSVTRDIELTKRNDRYRVGSLQRSYHPGDQVLRVIPIERPGGHSTEVMGPYEIVGPAGHNHYKIRGTPDRLPVHQLRPLTLDPHIRRGLQQDSSIHRASSVLYEKKLLTVAKDHLTAGDLVIHEIESFDLEHFYDCATVISNNLSKAQVEIRLMKVDDTGRWSLTDSTQAIPYHSIVATGFVLTKQNRVPVRILKMLSLASANEGEG